MSRGWGANYDFQAVIAMGCDVVPDLPEGVGFLQWIEDYDRILNQWLESDPGAREALEKMK